jgi:hypothetical protein
VLGFEILNPTNGCARRNGRTFLEGHLESMVIELRDDAQESLGQGRPSEPRAAQKTDDFTGAIRLSAFGWYPVAGCNIAAFFRGTDYGT